MQKYLKYFYFVYFNIFLKEKYINVYYRTLSTSWERFQKGIHQFALYSPDDSSIDDLLQGMTQEPIIDIGIPIYVDINFISVIDKSKQLFKFSI